MAEGGKPRTAWHPLFAALIEERKPSGFEVTVEPSLSTEPQRADLLLLRRSGDDSDARVLRSLWPRLAAHTLAEFKSSTRPPRLGDLIRLLSYGFQYHAAQVRQLTDHLQLTLVLLCPKINQAVARDIAAMGWSLTDLGLGYQEVVGTPYVTIVGSLADIAAAEGDRLLSGFADRTMKDMDVGVAEWFADHLGARLELDMGTRPEVVRLREKMRQVFTTAEMLEGLSAEERLEGLTAEERLEAIELDDAVLKLPDEVLRALPPAFVEGLPAEVRAKIRTRLGE